MSQVRAKKRKRQDSQHRLLAIVVMLAGVSCAAAASSFLPPVKAQEASQANLMKTTTTRQDFFQEPLGKQPGQVSSTRLIKMAPPEEVHFLLAAPSQRSSVVASLGRHEPRLFFRLIGCDVDLGGPECRPPL